jgi:hypothetical protein
MRYWDTSIETVEQFRRAIRLGPASHGYDYLYLCADGAWLCYHCAVENRRQIIDAISGGPHVNDQWRVIGFESTSNMEDAETCADCGLVYVPDE